PWYEVLVIPLRFMLLCSVMIPISMKVTMDMVKTYYALLIGWDVQMYDSKTDVPAVVNNSSIAEDLGQIGIILTDKTGTLTENSLEVKKCTIRGQAAGASALQEHGERSTGSLAGSTRAQGPYMAEARRGSAWEHGGAPRGTAARGCQETPEGCGPGSAGSAAAGTRPSARHWGRHGGEGAGGLHTENTAASAKTPQGEHRSGELAQEHGGEAWEAQGTAGGCGETHTGTSAEAHGGSAAQRGRRRSTARRVWGGGERHESTRLAEEGAPPKGEHSERDQRRHGARRRDPGDARGTAARRRRRTGHGGEAQGMHGARRPGAGDARGTAVRRRGRTVG
ncbi:hypothetical protein CYMTET_36009, partial [Cymbomonas tetramitiformis]